MEKRKIKKRLKELINHGDTELNHMEADELLCDFLISLGHKDIVKIYQEIPKWFA